MAISRNQLLIGGGIVGLLTVLYFVSRKRKDKVTIEDVMLEDVMLEDVQPTLGGIKPAPIVEEVDGKASKVDVFQPVTRFENSRVQNTPDDRNPNAPVFNSSTTPVLNNTRGGRSRSELASSDMGGNSSLDFALFNGNMNTLDVH